MKNPKPASKLKLKTSKSKQLYKCYIQGCIHHFIQPISLRRHLRMHFPKFDRFQCIHCPISFHKYSTLMVHLKSHSSEGKILKKSVFAIRKSISEKGSALNSQTKSSNQSLMTSCNNETKEEWDDTSISKESCYYDLPQCLFDLCSFLSIYNNIGNTCSNNINEGLS